MSSVPREKYRHIKTRGLYETVMTAIEEATGVELTIYRDQDGVDWSRPTTEFYDGRFEAIDVAPAQADGADEITALKTQVKYWQDKRLDAADIIDAQAAEIASLRERLAQYDELLYAVASKYHNETRHQTALRFIRDGETRATLAGQAALAAAQKEIASLRRRLTTPTKAMIQAAMDYTLEHRVPQAHDWGFLNALLRAALAAAKKEGGE